VGVRRKSRRLRVTVDHVFLVDIVPPPTDNDNIIIIYAHLYYRRNHETCLFVFFSVCPSNLHNPGFFVKRKNIRFCNFVFFFSILYYTRLRPARLRFPLYFYNLYCYKYAQITCGLLFEFLKS